MVVNALRVTIDTREPTQNQHIGSKKDGKWQLNGKRSGPAGGGGGGGLERASAGGDRAFLTRPHRAPPPTGAAKLPECSV